MPRTKGSKNRPKTNTTNDCASQIAEKQESIVSLTAEIASITANIDTLKADLKEKKTALKKAEKEVASLEAKKVKADAKAAEEAKKAEAETVLKKLKHITWQRSKATSRECVRLARYIFLMVSCTSKLARRRMFPSSCMLIRKQSCVHSRVASGFVLPVNW